MKTSLCHAPLAIDGYCTCSMRPISCKADDLLCYRVLYYIERAPAILSMNINCLCLKHEILNRIANVLQFTKVFLLNFLQSLFAKFAQLPLVLMRQISLSPYLPNFLRSYSPHFIPLTICDSICQNPT